MPISSQAPKGDGSETISKESRLQVESKRPTPNNWGDDIVQSSWKREAALKKLVTNLSIVSNGCWEWQGAKSDGYGTLKLPSIYGKFKILAHRLSWVAFKGEAIKDGLFVCHRCDNPRCFNPDHLFLGTQKDNLIDCSNKGRTMTGTLNGNSKYSETEIKAVIDLLAKGYSGIEIHKITCISRTHISRIKRGYTRKFETSPTANFVHANRKYSDEQIIRVAKMIHDDKLSHSEIAKITDTTRYLVSDMKKGKIHQKFMKRVANNDCD